MRGSFERAAIPTFKSSLSAQCQCASGAMMQPLSSGRSADEGVKVSQVSKVENNTLPQAGAVIIRDREFHGAADAGVIGQDISGWSKAASVMVEGGELRDATQHGLWR